MLPKKFRLPAKEFGQLYKIGKKIRGKYGMLIVKDNSVGNPRFGFVLSKKIGNAVFRHRMARLLRIIVMDIVNEENLSLLSKDFDYIAFVFCDKKNLLKDEILDQIKGAING